LDILNIFSFVHGLVKELVNFISGPPLWLKVSLGSVSRKIETGNKIRELEFYLQMVNEVPSRLIRVDGVTLELPELGIRKVKESFEGRLGSNRHWSQSWPIHLGNDNSQAGLRITIDVTAMNQIPKELLVKLEVKAPKGIQRKKVLKKRLSIPDAR